MIFGGSSEFRGGLNHQPPPPISTPLGIINVDFDAAGQLLIKYSAFVKYLGGGNGNKMKQ